MQASKVVTVLVLAGAAFAGKPTPPLLAPPFTEDRARSLQAEWAKAFTLSVQVTNSVGMKLVLIPGGRFDMGPAAVSIV